MICYEIWIYCCTVISVNYDCMMFLQPKSSSVEGPIKYKNLLGYGDLWDGSIAYGFDHSAEVIAGVYFSRLKALVALMTARVYLLTQDWLNFSSYKERSIGISLGLFWNRYHNLDYHLAWGILADSLKCHARL